jgi:hypothetical protein
MAENSSQYGLMIDFRIDVVAVRRRSSKVDVEAVESCDSCEVGDDVLNVVWILSGFLGLKLRYSSNKGLVLP